MDEKLKKRKHAKKEQFSEWGGGKVIRVMTGWSGGKRALTLPPTKILRTP